MALVLFMHRGGSAEWSIPLTSPTGVPKDLTAATGLVFLAKRRIDDADVDAAITSTPVVTDAAGGIVRVKLAPADSVSLDPRLYVWGMQLLDGSGNLWEFPDPSQEPGKLIIRAGVVVAT